jgi:hypothetical protein
MVGIACSGQCPYDNQATGGQLRQTVPDKVAKPALHHIPHDSIANGFADDETRTRLGNALPRRVRVRGTTA